MLNLRAMLAQLEPGSSARLELQSGRRPRIVNGANLKNLADEILTDEEVIEACRGAGAGSAVDDLGDRPHAWTMRGPRGQVSASIALKGREVCATFTPADPPRSAAEPPRDAPRQPPTRRHSAGRQPAAQPQSARGRHSPPSGRRATPRPAHRAEPEHAPRATRRSDPVLAAHAAPAAGSRAKRIDEGLLDALHQARRAGASDLHVSAGPPASIRVGGELRALRSRFARADVDRALSSLLPERLARAYEDAGGVCFALTVDSSTRIRVNATRTFSGTKLAIRFLGTSPATVESLGLPPEVALAMDQPQGLVLVVGPSGHGKTTTMAALVDRVNRSRRAHIITVEDPVEIPIASDVSSVSQREVGTHAASFHRALEGALRQDPDVVAVGELRDLEAMRMAIAASETGHLVIASMNAPSAPRAVERVIEVFSPAEQPQIRAILAGGLRLVLSQRLVPTADGKDRALAFEMIPGSVPLWNLIREEKTFQIPSLMQRGRGIGIVTLEESLRALVDKGTVTPEAARAVTEDGEPGAGPDLAGGQLEAPRYDTGLPPPGVAQPEEFRLAGLLQKAGAIFSRKGGS
jgi:twitching motility protein PilT